MSDEVPVDGKPKPPAGRAEPAYPWQPPAPKFDIPKLITFALKRGMSIGEPGWENAVILQAAIEHRELTAERRSRGRPRFKWTPFRALLGISDSHSRQRTDDLYRWVEQYRLASATGENKMATIREGIRAYVETVEGVSREVYDFVDRVQIREVEFHAARRRLKGSKKTSET